MKRHCNLTSSTEAIKSKSCRFAIRKSILDDGLLIYKTNNCYLKRAPPRLFGNFSAFVAILKNSAHACDSPKSPLFQLEMAATLVQHLSLEKHGDYYVSKYLPQRMGNTAHIAYGGYAIGFAIRAAYERAPDGFHLYSALGHYIRPLSTEVNIMCRVIELRKSKNFATYRVAVEQAQSNSETRSCMEFLADFHRNEPPLLTFSAQPTREYSHWRECVRWEDLEEAMIRSGKLSRKQAASNRIVFALSRTVFETLPCPEGIASQNMMGIAKTIKTTQDHLSPSEKSSADWIRVKHPVESESQHMASLGFILDGMLSFLPLTHSHMFLDDAGACSSLDFALRIFSPTFNINNWNLRECTSHSASHGLSYSESRVWNDEGKMIACMTQQCILRVPENIVSRI